MSETHFGVIRTRVGDRIAKKLDRICKEEGGHCFTSANIPGGGFQGWFTGPNMGHPFDDNLAKRVKARVATEVRDFWA